jgi:Tol biopolymer transport system component
MQARDVVINSDQEVVALRQESAPQESGNREMGMSMRGRMKGKSGSRSATTILAALSIIGSLAAPSSAYERPGRFERVSLASDGSEGEDSLFPGSGGTTNVISSISANGRFVAFQSNKNRLDRNDVNQANDIFVHDRQTHETRIVSVSSTGTVAIVPPTPGTLGPGRGSTQPFISSTGRYVVFSSTAINLVPGDTNLAEDVFRHDRVTGKTLRASVNSEGKEAMGPAINHDSNLSSIDASGRLVVFASDASNLIDNDANESRDIFLHDMRNGRTTLVSAAADGTQANATWGVAGQCGSISANGRYVAFTSGASNLVTEDPSDTGLDVFVKDLEKGSVEHVGGGTNCSSEDGPGQISSDGRYVLFATGVAGVVPNDSNVANDVFLKDRKTGRTERISVSGSGEESEGLRPISPNSSPQTISAGGRYVVFLSAAENFGAELPPGTDMELVAYLHDRRLGITEAVSVPPGGLPPVQVENCVDQSQPYISGSPAVSANGRHIVFTSRCDFQEGESTLNDTYVRDRGLDLGLAKLLREGQARDVTLKAGRFSTGNGEFSRRGYLTSRDDRSDVNDVLTGQGANLYGASLAYRPQYQDLFAAIELEYMPQVLPGFSPLFYGLRFKVEGKSYEVRATSLAFGTFGLFDCTDSPTCTKIADLNGGYGTTGMRVVLSLPLDKVGLESGGQLKNVEAFSGIGTYATGAARVLDTVALAGR